MSLRGLALNTAEVSGSSRGVVVVYSPDQRGFVHDHERVTRAGIAKRLAALKGFDYAGAFEPVTRYPGAVYFVPNDTLVGIDRVRELGIRSEHDLFGGVVAAAFVATKAITHPLVRPDAYAPEGWSHFFPRRVENAVLAGFAAFTREDVHRAGLRLLEHGPVRVKPASATGGHGQSVVHDADGLEAVIAVMNTAELSSRGVVLEQNLTDVTTYSVGQVRVADLVASYCGTQRLTRDNRGADSYGGSDLVVARGDFDALLRLDLSEAVRLAIAQAQAYDRAAMETYPGMFASRRNYDIAAGLDHARRRRSGVLEQSWRVGGASGAEVAALEAFQGDPALAVVRASAIEVYGGTETPPPAAIVYFRGVDPQVGPITKYTLVESHADPR
jgi:hypothetical protein